jgi:tRNA(Ile)-lysidine synthase
LLKLGRQARSAPSRPWLASLPAGLYVPQRTLERVDRLAAQGRGTRRIAVVGGAIVVRYGQVAWESRVGGAGPAAIAPVRVRRPGVYRVAAPPAPAVDVMPPMAGPPPSGNAACFDPTRVGWPLMVRAPRPGDRMLPRGGRGSRKLSDLLVDAKVPREQRALLPVLCEAGGAILFVPGLRPSEVGRPGTDTREWFEVRVAR